MPRYASRVDANHRDILRALRQCGWYVRDQSSVGGNWPDLFLAKFGRVVLAEVKDGSKVPSAQKLSPGQAALHSQLGQYGVRCVVLRSVDDAMNL